MEKKIVSTIIKGVSETAFDFYVKKEDVLNDLKIILADYYWATFLAEDDFLSIRFANGQNFNIIVKEMQ